MTKELQTLQEEVSALKAHNTEVMAIINSDTPLTHKIKAMLAQPKIRAEFLELLPDVANREQILRSELQSIIFDIMQSPELQQCTPQSFLFSLKDSLARGLRIGSSYKEAWLVKFNNKQKGPDGKDVWVNEAKIMVGYRAYINKAWNENKVRFVVGTITKDEVQYVSFDRSAGKLEIFIPLGKETKLHTRENIEYVYVTSIAQDGSKWSDLYTREAIEEKSKVGKWEGKGDNKTKVYKLGAVWDSTDRLTDYKEMLHKGAIILFNKMQPSRGLNELADFDHRQLESMQDVTPIAPTVPALSASTSAINDILSGNQHKVISNDTDPETGEILEPIIEHPSTVYPSTEPPAIPQIKVYQIEGTLDADWDRFVADFIAEAYSATDIAWLQKLKKNHESPIGNLFKTNKELHSRLVNTIAARERELA